MATPVLPRPKQHKLEFIVSSSSEKPDQNARQLIRSHVMRHKNQRKRAVDRPKLRSWINQESCTQQSQLLSKSANVSNLYFSLPRQLGSDLPVTQFAYNMPPYALDLVFKFFTVVGQAMYPIQLCLIFDVRNSIWIEYLAVDAVYCHSVLWITQAYFDWVKSAPSFMNPSYIQIKHAHETLRTLQQRLTDSRLATSDVIICVVVAFVMMSALVGDYESAMKHMMGLYKLVELRGGIRTFMQNGQAQLKTCRADLAMALITDKKPLFFSNDDISWEPYIARVQNTPTSSSNSNSNSTSIFISTTRSSPSLRNPKPFITLGPKLSNIWADLQEFTKSANLAFQTGQKMDCILFQEILISVQYRLLLLDMNTTNTNSPSPSPSPSLNQIIYVGMLAFSTNIFLQMHGLAMRFEKLSTRLRESILSIQEFDLELKNDESMVELKMWLLFVAQMFIFRGVDQNNQDSMASDSCSWLKIEMRKVVRGLNLTEWRCVRERLKRFLWIDVLHDDGAKKAFEDTISGSSERGI